MPNISISVDQSVSVDGIATIMIIRDSTQYTHEVTYSFSGYTGVVGPFNSDYMCRWPIPDSFCNAFRRTTQLYCYLECKTYNTGGTLVDTTSTMFLVYANEKPEITRYDVYDTEPSVINYLTGNNRCLVTGLSNACYELDAEAKQGAGISKAVLNKTNISHDPLFPTTTNDSFAKTFEGRTISFSVQDSRGVWNDISYLYDRCVDYIKPTITPQLKRESPSGGAIIAPITMTFGGKWFNGNFGIVSNALKIKYRYRGNDIGDTWSSFYNVSQSYISTNGNNFSSVSEVSLGSNFSIGKTYTFEITVYDTAYERTNIDNAKCGVTCSVALPTPIFDWGKNDFNLNVDLYMGGKNFYECGTYTPKFYTNSAGTTEITGSQILEGFYCRIGNLVFFRAFIQKYPTAFLCNCATLPFPLQTGYVNAGANPSITWIARVLDGCSSTFMGTGYISNPSNAKVSLNPTSNTAVATSYCVSGSYICDYM